jgi:hypothetical protein
MDMRGRWYRWNKKSLEKTYLALDVAHIARKTKLELPASYTWVWTGPGVDNLQAKLHVDMVPDHGLCLSYSHLGQAIAPYLAPVVTTQPHYGGKRYWFLCPNQNCRKRVRILYGGKYFLCRHCQSLTYETAQTGGNLIVTIDSRLTFLRRKLGANGWLLDGPPEKPPRMHSRTYMRLAKEYINLLRMREQAFAYEMIHLLQVFDLGNDLPVMPKETRQDLLKGWKTLKAQRDEK